MNQNVLIACPSYAGKSYCLETWAEHCAAALADYREHYPGARTDVLIVDNTRNSDGYAKLIANLGMRVIKVTPEMLFEPTIHLCWQIIHQEAIIEDYDWVFSVEADNIIPPYILTRLMEIALAGRFHIVTHTYPFHLLNLKEQGWNRTTNPHRFYYNELGICLMTRQVLSYGLADYSRYDNFTNALFHSVSRYSLGWASSTSIIPKEENIHLDGYETEFSQFLAPQNDGRWNPYEDLDLSEIYGQQLPECIREDYEKYGGAVGGGLKMADGTYKAVATGKRIRPRKTRAKGKVVSGNGKGKATNVGPLGIRARARGGKG